MRRVIKIIFILILIIATIAAGTWMLSLKKAQTNGEEPRSFRQFLGLGDRASQTPSENEPGEFSSDFTPDTTPSETPDQTGTPAGGFGTVQVSQFTSSPLTPSQSGTGFGGSGTGTGTPGQTGSGAISTAPTIPPAPTTTQVPGIGSNQCSESDISIAFTSDEIARLNDLQNRFYAVSQSLRTDSDLEAESSNYDTFKAKAEQATELYNYCLSIEPRITDPILKNRVPTPFWRDSARDVRGYIHARSIRDMVQSTFGGVPFLNSSTIDPRNVTSTQVALEAILRISWW